MKAIRVIATERQPEVIWQGRDAIVHFNEQEAIRTLEDGTTQIEYVYTAVIVRDAKRYADVVSAAKKAARSYDVDHMLVEHGGHVWQVDETSQLRLIRQREMMKKLEMETAEWRDFGNVYVPVTLDDIEQILLRAGEEQTRIWRMYT